MLNVELMRKMYKKICVFYEVKLCMNCYCLHFNRFSDVIRHDYVLLNRHAFGWCGLITYFEEKAFNILSVLS